MIYLYQWGCKAAEDLCRQKEQAGQLWWLLYRLCTAIKACARTVAQVRNGLGERIGEMPWPGKDDPGGRGKQRRQGSDGWRYG